MQTDTSSCRVPVTEEDKKKSYYHFFEREMTPPDPAIVEKVLKGPIAPKDALPLENMNRLFDPGYMSEEVGYCILEDGTGYMASKVAMPDVTADMFDWWFAWHGLDNLRYKIWDNEDHYKAECQQPEIASNRALSFKERYVNTVHYIEEDLGAGIDKAYLHFMDPAHCMVHFLREVNGVMELRSRSWLGRTIKDGKPFRSIPMDVQIPEIAPKMLLLHCLKEFSNLAAILPQVYAEEHDEI